MCGGGGWRAREGAGLGAEEPLMSEMGQRMEAGDRAGLASVRQVGSEWAIRAGFQSSETQGTSGETDPRCGLGPVWLCWDEMNFPGDRGKDPTAVPKCTLTSAIVWPCPLPLSLLTLLSTLHTSRKDRLNYLFSLKTSGWKRERRRNHCYLCRLRVKRFRGSLEGQPHFRGSGPRTLTIDTVC